jgi:hypothetical protein
MTTRVKMTRDVYLEGKKCWIVWRNICLIIIGMALDVVASQVLTGVSIEGTALKEKAK